MRKSLAAAVAVLALSGCAYDGYYGNYGYYSEGWWGSQSRFVNANYDAVDTLAKSVSMPLRTPIVVATVVDVDNLDHSSTFGRLVTEQVASRLAMLGYSPIELKLRGNLFVRAPAGELLLSREVSQIAQQHNAPVVVVGSYGRGYSTAYVSLKLVAVADNQILAGTDYPIPLTENLRRLVGSDSRYY